MAPDWEMSGQTVPMSRKVLTGQPILTPLVQDRWLPAVFSLVPEGASRRRPSDVVRIVAAIGVVVLAVGGTTWLTAGQSWFGAGVDAVPRDLRWLLAVAGPGLLTVAVVVVLVSAVVARRLGLGLALFGAGLAAAVLSLALDEVFGDRYYQDLVDAGIDTTAFEHRFPPLLLAVTMAMAFAATPFLTLPATRLLRGLIVVAAGCSLALGLGFPAAVAVAVAVGWGCAAGAHLAIGSPAATPARSDIADALHAFGLAIDVDHISLDPVQLWGETRFVADDGSSPPLQVSAIGRDASEARLLSKLIRTVWYKDSGPSMMLSRGQQVEHQAFVLLLAERVDVEVPELVAVGIVGESESALLVTRPPTGTPLSQIGVERITDDLLDRAWRVVTALHGARLSHGRFSADELLVRDDGSLAVRDATSMTSSAPPLRVAQDSVDFLVAVAGLVGVDRAVASASRALDRDGLVEMIPLVQPGVVAKPVRRSVDKPKALVSDLRAALIVTTGIEEPPLAELRRVRPSTIAMAAGAALGVYLLIGELASVADQGNVFKDPNWGWIVLVAGFSQLPQVAQAIGMLGSVAAKLPLGPATAVQFANQFTGLVGGTVATTALVVRFFQKRGLAVAVAISSGVLNTAAAMVAQTVLCAIGLLFTISDFDFSFGSSSSGGGGGSSDAQVFVIVILVVAGLAGIALVVPRLRSRLRAAIAPQIQAARDNFDEIARTPGKALQLFGGNVASQLLFALTLSAALHAYDQSLPLLQIIVINTFASLIGGIAPIPGGMGVIEAGLIGGFTAAGIAEGPAIAATFTARTFTAYLPPIWGWFSLDWLRKHDYI